jgi:RNA polymerase sigma-70 factor (ECF subfamily)
VSEASPDDRLAQLMDESEGRLYGFVLTLVGDRDAAADCIQDTFLRAYDHLRKRKPVSVQWLYRVARNRAMDEHRRRKVGDRKHANLGTHAPTFGESAETAGDVRRALSALSPEDREVLYLYTVDGFSGEEIGAMLGIRPDAVRMRISRARRRFRTAYGDGL